MIFSLTDSMLARNSVRSLAETRSLPATVASTVERTKTSSPRSRGRCCASLTTRVYGICTLVFLLLAVVVGTTLGVRISALGGDSACKGCAGRGVPRLVGGANGVR